MSNEVLYAVIFFLATWSAQYVFPLLDFDSALLGFRSLLSGIIIMYVLQDAPGLDRTPEEFYKGIVNRGAWEDLIVEILDDNTNYEFHVYKVRLHVVLNKKFLFIRNLSH